MDSNSIIWLSLLFLFLLIIILIVAFWEFDRPAVPTPGETVHIVSIQGLVVGSESDYPTITTSQRLVAGSNFPFTGHVIQINNGIEFVGENPEYKIYTLSNDPTIYFGIPPQGSNTLFEYSRSRQIYVVNTNNAWSATNPVGKGSLLQLEGGQGNVTILGFNFFTVAN